MVLFGEFLRAVEFLYADAMRFAQLDGPGNVENGFTAAISNMDVNGQVVIAVEEETVAVLLKDFRHGANLERG